jgi:thiol-disulfide isomerase/thioredoxin
MKGFVLAGMAACLTAALFGQEFTLGSKVTDFGVFDLNGKLVQFSSMKRGVTVLMFIATRCPVSNAYNERMKALYGDYGSKGVRFVAINSNYSELPPEVAEHAAGQGFPFKVYKDNNNNIVADLFGAHVTPETLVLDKTSVIRYHGYIDDSQNPAGVTVQALRMALDAVLAGTPVKRAETQPFGSAIKRVTLGIPLNPFRRQSPQWPR